MTDKRRQRTEAKEIRNGLPSDIRKQASLEIGQRIRRCAKYQSAQTILSYSPIGSEVDASVLNRMVLEDGKRLFLPKTYKSESRMEFYEVTDFDELSFGYQNILEPKEGIPYAGEENVLMILPGLAFDRRKYRMGYGGGFYDRYIERYPKAFKVMAAFSAQEQKELVVESHDIKMDLIVTETEVIQ